MCAFGSRVNDIALASLFFFDTILDQSLFFHFVFDDFSNDLVFFVSKTNYVFILLLLLFHPFFWSHLFVLFVSVLFIFTSIILQYFQNWLGHISHTSKYKCIRECILNIWFLNTSSNEILYIFLQNQLELTNVPFKIHVFFFVR